MLTILFSALESLHDSPDFPNCNAKIRSFSCTSKNFSDSVKTRYLTENQSFLPIKNKRFD